MKNILEFNDFIENNKENSITESIEHVELITEAADHGKFFENVKGNMAGAENTLIGSAVMKLFGFIKRKGMQAYLRAVLKPKLGEVYFQNILRYVAMNPQTINPPKEKDAFEIKSLKGNVASKETTRARFKKEETVGLLAFVVGATVTKEKDNSSLEDGRYMFLYYIGSSFTVEGGIITKLDYGMSTSEQDRIEESKTTEKEETKKDDVVVQTETEKKVEELETYKEEQTKIAGSSKADADIIENCNKLKVYYKKISEEGKLTLNILKPVLHKIETDSNDLKRLGLKEIDDMLESKTLDAKSLAELKLAKETYTANIVAFTELHIYLLNLLPPKVPPKPVDNKTLIDADKKDESLLSYGNKLFEAEGIVTKNTKKIPKVPTPTVIPGKGTKNYNTSNDTLNTTKVGDPLKELEGKTVDFSDPNFYKQFDEQKHKDGVTNTILENKADVIKLQLKAVDIIGDSKSLLNNWERMVQDVLGKYAKFMITDKVNPFTLAKDGSPEQKAIIKEEIKKDGVNKPDPEKLAQLSIKLSNTPTFNKVATSIGDLKTINEKNGGIISMSIQHVSHLFVYKVHKLKYTSKNDKTGADEISTRMALRIVGYITKENQEKISTDENITDYKQYITTGVDLYKLFCNDNDFEDDYLGKLNGIYLVGNKTMYQVNPKIDQGGAVLLLYYKDKFNENADGSYVFKIKNTENKALVDLTKGVSVAPSKFKSTINIYDAAFLFRIDNPDEFVDYEKQILTTIQPKFATSLNKIIPPTT